jgi:hypothetical protein
MDHGWELDLNISKINSTKAKDDIGMRRRKKKLCWCTVVVYVDGLTNSQLRLNNLKSNVCYPFQQINNVQKLRNVSARRSTARTAKATRYLQTTNKW